MADYLPLFKPGANIPSTASAAIAGGQLLMVSGSGTVAPATAATPAWVGVAAFDVAIGGRINIHKSGVQRMIASGAITAGDLVVAAAAGQVSTAAAVTTPTAADVSNTRALVGVALTTAATGQPVDVDFIR